MKRRRMYRFARAQQPQPQPQRMLPATHERVVPMHQEPSMEQVFFERGVARGMQIAAQQQHQRIAEVKRNTLQQAQSEPFMVMARQQGYEQGYAAALRQHPGGQGRVGAHYTHADIQRARQQGFEEGRRAAGGIPNVNKADVRKKAIDDVMSEVRVISESNPNMAPGPFLKALKHRVKKIG